MLKLAGRWTETTAGGCRNYESWSQNPQFVVHVVNDTSAVIVLSQVKTYYYV